MQYVHGVQVAHGLGDVQGGVEDGVVVQDIGLKEAALRGGMKIQNLTTLPG